jgi:alpha-mannosidase
MQLSLYSVIISTVIVDVEVYHLETREALLFSNITIVETGPIRAALRAEVKLANSTFVTTVS